MNVLISGASIAGPALAYWLRRYGFGVTVVERSPELRPGGQAVDLRGVAKKVVRRMGLDAEVRAACTDTLGLSYVTKRGWRVASTTVDEHGGDGFVAEIEILRGDLARVLYDATSDGVEYLFGDRIVALEQDADGVTVDFAGGARRRFDLVIGADGLHSGVRALAFGPESDYLRHLGLYFAFFTVPNRPRLDRWMLGYDAPGRSCGVRSIHDNADAMAYFAFRSPELDYDPRDAAAQRALVRERITGLGWEAPWLLDRMDEAPDFFFDSIAQIHLPEWSNGRVALLGDAAFCPSPMSGQGTSLAVVGAYVLAGELAQRSGDHAGAFAEYQRRMGDWVTATQKMGAAHAAAASPDSQWAIFRQYLAAWTEHHFPRLARLGGGDGGAALGELVKGIELPDYEPAH
ncbi:FAD-dependent monooxygenase [Pseudonocardia eucalypti]|uniref:FAD-dependent monooxygenase n=1 Tax=Pseudonocardia eucalypti TaxID=648755 RepID=A0ABP9R183_9PSEU|nr:2-polyprenyl-6-methoxyphenol hydroxylase-like FAD-dependent oxidoreductase [Pseudonocardia eucalypti]